MVGGGGKKRKGKSTTLVATMHARSAATSIINKTINRKHGRTTSGAVTLKVRGCLFVFLNAAFWTLSA